MKVLIKQTKVFFFLSPELLTINKLSFLQNYSKYLKNKKFFKKEKQQYDIEKITLRVLNIRKSKQKIINTLKLYHKKKLIKVKTLIKITANSKKKNTKIKKNTKFVFN